ncbi:MAG TPA: 50S ribosome-binding GTPase, partial [Exilispira sp.]|nr:50S ribosome-binding GTPase [Exilispira sp.]
CIKKVLINQMNHKYIKEAKMAINKQKTKEIIEEIDQLFDQLIGNINPSIKVWIEKNLLGPAFEEIKKLIEDSRPPKMFLIGRSGHGKSSLINALANKHVAEVGDVKPTTYQSIPYLIKFEESYSSWEIIDSRGLFESTSPNSLSNIINDNIEENKKINKNNHISSKNDIEQILTEEIIKYKPDIIMHVISAPETRNLSNDLSLVSKMMTKLNKTLGYKIPLIIVLTKVDTLENPRHWPLENYPAKVGILKEILDYTSDEILTVSKTPIDLNELIKGYEIKDSEDITAIIPVCSLKDDIWNIETLIDFIGQKLPENAVLEFAQAQKRKKLLRKLSSSLIIRFSSIAGIVGLSPLPISDIIILTPMQILLVTLIGGLSCRKISKETFLEFLSASGITVASGFTFRAIAHQLVKLIPIAGSVISGTIASSGTYGIGKAAEAYFFEGKIKKPIQYKDEWQEYQNNIKQIENSKKLV